MKFPQNKIIITTKVMQKNRKPRTHGLWLGIPWSFGDRDSLMKQFDAEIPQLRAWLFGKIFPAQQTVTKKKPSKKAP